VIMEDQSSTPARRPRHISAAGAGVEVWLGKGSLLQDEMLLSLFLKPWELLRLSETAKRLLPYRQHLRTLDIREWDNRLPAVIAPQKCLRIIDLRASSHVLDLFRALRGVPGEDNGPGRGLTYLAVIPKPPYTLTFPTDLPLEAWREVGECLAGGTCPELRVIGLPCYRLGVEEIGHITQGLLTGCRRLMILVLGILGPGGGEALAAAVRGGMAPDLKMLTLVWGEGAAEGLRAVAGALQARDFHPF
jgi:hypothetical protein